MIEQSESLVLYLYYKEGLSFRQISKLMCIPRSTVFDMYQRSLAAIADSVDPSSPDAILSIEGFFTRWCDGEQRRPPRFVALRQEQVAQELDQRMDMRASELEALSECMGANCSVSHKRNKGAAWTQSEMRYLSATGRTTIPTDVYGHRKRGNSLAYYCACDAASCPLSCTGCRERR